MSKLYKDLNYDTDRVMQPGDPITSPNGTVSVHADDDGTAKITVESSLPDSTSLGTLASSLSLTDDDTLGRAAEILGLGDSDVIAAAQSGDGPPTVKTIATTDQIVSQVNSDWNASSGVARILNKPALGDAASRNVGTSSGTVAAGDHTHSSLKSGNFTASLPTLSSNATLSISGHSHTAGSVSYNNDSVQYALDDIYGTNLWMNGNDYTLRRDSSVVPTLVLDGKTVATTDQIPAVPSAATANPAMDGTAAVGSSTKWAKEDHVHPTDTSRAAVSDLRYAFNTPAQATSGTSVSLSLNDRSINQVSLESTVTTATISFPAKTAGYARDFFVRLTITGSTVPAITWQEANGDPIDFDVDDDSWADIEQGVNILMFTETSQASAS